MRKLMRLLDGILRIVLVVLFIALLIALAVSKPLGTRSVSPGLETTVEQWQSDMTTAGIDWRERYSLLRSIRFAELDPGQAGYSNYSAHTVEIAADLPQEGEYTLKTTVYHELGHSVFRLKHGSCAIMSEENRSESECRANWSSWVKEYTNACKQVK